VTILIPGGEDVRPLQIVGADAVTDLAHLPGRDEPPPMAIAVSAGVYAGDPRVQAWFGSTPTAEVMMWGTVPSNLRYGSSMSCHRLSRAARGFKAYAFAAASVRDRVMPTESFQTLRREISGCVLLDRR
jgi:hypothetical protein